MAEPIYKVHKRFKKKILGCTNPRICSLYGVLKHNNPESPNCIYNEYVAVQLARLLKVPLCDGVLAYHETDIAYVSLMLSVASLSLPDSRESQMYRLCSLYPQEAAEIFAFDMLIGNYDRRNHIKATFVSPEFPLFRAFDHSNTLLNVFQDPEESFAILASNECLVEFHPFAPYISRSNVSDAIDDIQGCNREALANCCVYTDPFAGVSIDLQLRLASTLVGRVDRLGEIFERFSRQIKG